LPYLLRRESHILTTEGIAMLFGELSLNTGWLNGMKLTPQDPNQAAQLREACEKSNKAHLLIFSRWCQVMLRFERAMYEDPSQDLNKKWWDLVEEYQRVNRPEGRNEPDYASKIHIVSAPVYYHNYMMGEMFASQVFAALRRELYPGQDRKLVGLAGNPKVGTFFIDKVFSVGNSLSWNELTKHASGEYLTPRYFAQDFE